MIFLLTWLLTFFAYAELSFPDDKSALNIDAKKVLEAINGAEKSIAEVNIRIQGAQVRNFRLYSDFVFSGLNNQQKKQAQDIKANIEKDLNLVSGFDMIKSIQNPTLQLLQQQGCEGKIELSFKFIKDKISIDIKAVNFINNQLVNKTFEFSSNNTRIHHYLAKVIFETFIGPEDIFLRQLAAVKTENNKQQIVLMDFDGNNQKIITQDNWPKVSPSFSPDGKSLFYSVITEQGHGIIEHDLVSNKRVFRTKALGVNMEPRVHPNNKCMLASLSLEKATNIYKANRDGSNLVKITQSLGMSLSPFINQKGDKIVYVSDRSGNPQVYMQNLTATCDLEGAAKRLTFLGNYNQNPSISSDDNYVVFVGRDESYLFDIFLIELASLKVSRITQNQGSNKSPIFSPSSRYVLFSSQRSGDKKFHLYISNFSGNKQTKITTDNSSYDSFAINPVLLQ